MHPCQFLEVSSWKKEKNNTFLVLTLTKHIKTNAHINMREFSNRMLRFPRGCIDNIDLKGYRGSTMRPIAANQYIKISDGQVRTSLWYQTKRHLAEAVEY